MGGHEPALGPEGRTQVGGLDPQLGGQCHKLRPPGESQVPGTTLVVTTFPKDALRGGLEASSSQPHQESYWSDSIAMPILQETRRRGKALGYKLAAEPWFKPMSH